MVIMRLLPMVLETEPKVAALFGQPWVAERTFDPPVTQPPVALTGMVSGTLSDLPDPVE